MKKLWIGIGIVVVVALAILLIVTQTTKEPEEIKIGAILPLTGPSALLGEIAKNGLLLSEQDINANGGIKGKKLKIIFEDGMADPNKSISAFNKLITTDKIRFAITTHSGVGLALAPIADKHKIMLFVHASHPGIVQESAFIFRHSNIAEQESEIIGAFIRKSFNMKNIALAVMNDDYGLIFNKTLSNALATNTEDNFINSVIYDQSETDFKTVTQQILRDKPQTVIVAGLGNGVGLLLRRLKEYGYGGNIIITLGAVATGAFKSAGESAKGVYYVELDFNTNDAKYKNLSNRYKKAFNSDLSSASTLFYNSLSLLSYANGEAGNNPEKVSNFIQNLSSYQGIGEQMTINGKNMVPPLKVIRNE